MYFVALGPLRVNVLKSTPPLAGLRAPRLWDLIDRPESQRL